MNLTLYGCANSRSLRATWALEYAGADYNYVHVDLFSGEGRRQPFIDVNPAGKVPVLVDGEFTLTESAAIVGYIGERFPACALVPQPAAERADYWRWVSFIITELEQPLWTIAKHRFILPKELRLPQAEPAAIHDFEAACRILEQHLLDRKFIQKHIFSGTDILATHTLAWARSARIPIESTRLNAYLDENYASPAAERARIREQDAARAAKASRQR